MATQSGRAGDRRESVESSVPIAWHVVAAATMCVMAAANMHSWLSPDLLPAGDFAGYVTVINEVRDAVLRHGLIPAWSTQWFGGATRFLSSFKEIATLPLAVSLGGVRGTELMIFLLKVFAALGMYGLCTRYFRSPGAGIVAGYAYAFCMVSNYTASKLDVALSMALFPLITLAAVEALRRGSRRWAAGLGALVACEFCVNPAQSAMCVTLVGILAVMRPWRDCAARDGAAAVAAGWKDMSLVLATAVVVFAIFAASQLAWVLADARNHALFRAEHVAWGIERFIEQSPFVYLNRGNWLGGWLANHHPPDMRLFPESPLVDQRHYLGVVAVAVCLYGWFAARKVRALRRWYQALAILLLLQYWLSMGPRSLIWQIAQALHWSDSFERAVTRGASLGAAACLVWAASLMFRIREPGHGRRERLELATGMLVLLLLAGHPLFTPLRLVLPPLRGMRAPGHFFELIPFSLYFLLGLGLVAIGRRRPRWMARGALTGVIAVAVVIDFWPSAHAFSRGSRLQPVRELRSAIGAITAPHPLARIALLPGYSPTSWVEGSFAASLSRGGVAWGWLPWQACKHWPTFLKGAMLWVSDTLDADERELLRPISDALGRMGRIKYVLDEPGRGAALELAEPWRRRARNGKFALWERPSVMPPAYASRSYAVFAGDNDFVEMLAVYYGFKHNMVVISGGERLSEVPAPLVDAAGVVVASRAAVSDRGDAALALRYADRLVLGRPRDVATGYDQRFARVRAGRLVDVRYERKAPGHIVLAVDAGKEPAVVFVSESYHPWWRIRVDGAPGTLLRAGIAFMATRVESGRHTISMRFVPPRAVLAAEWVTLIGWCAALCWSAAALTSRVRPWLWAAVRARCQE